MLSRYPERIYRLLADLNDLDIQSDDIENAYIIAPYIEHVCTIGVNDGCSHQYKPFNIARAFYRLKISTSAFRAHFSEKLDEICFKSSTADTDLWMRAAVKQYGDN